MAQPTPSPLQSLPPHVVKLIVDHVTGSSRVVSDGVGAYSRKYWALLKPMLSVSPSFREIALSYYWKSLEVNLTNQTLDAIRGYRPPFSAAGAACHRAGYLDYPINHLAKDVTVYLDKRDVFSGEALNILSGTPYDNCVLQRVRDVKFEFQGSSMDDEGDDDNIVVDPASTEANVRAFVQRVKQMVPMASEIKVVLSDPDGNPSANDESLDYLVFELYQLVRRISYCHTSYHDDPLCVPSNVSCNLTHITYESNARENTVDVFIALAMWNALTLQSLSIKSTGGMDVLSLVWDAEDGHVTYPHLVSLVVGDNSCDKEWNRPTSRGAAPFPALRQLVTSCDRFFDDDTLFRGNAATLEKLSFYLDSESVSMLRKYKVFAPGRHPKLQAVELCLSEDFELESFASPAEAMEFVHNIGSRAAIRRYDVEVEVDILLSFDGHACIQVLNLQTIQLELATVLALVKSLPLLSDLHTGMPALGPMPDGVTMDALPEYVISQHAPMGKRFRCWHLYNRYDRHYHELATWVTCALLLALVCPNFAYAAPPSETRKLFMEQMEREIASDRFKLYAPRLRPLLFLGWNGKND
ncbi:hypothetical protein GGI18_000816 [Coemansia linderi]|uniref:Uncharacterized protein n=1 Tax=Coemansia linderi TaxID=2663919 RepID=A0ACC1KLX6_9FUNG|nr:hypothetical protein GGI18_000816 [Coemansia linderi]